MYFIFIFNLSRSSDNNKSIIYVYVCWNVKIINLFRKLKCCAFIELGLYVFKNCIVYVVI